MKDEIKEILDNLKYTAKKHTIQVLEDGGKIEHCPQEVATELRLNTYSANILLDYITNLQENLETVSGSHFKIFQENKILKEERKTLYKYTPEKGFRLVGDEE